MAIGAHLALLLIRTDIHTHLLTDIHADGQTKSSLEVIAIRSELCIFSYRDTEYKHKCCIHCYLLTTVLEFGLDRADRVRLKEFKIL